MAQPEMSRIVAIVQARMSSSRFPGKVLKPLCGMPMIVFMLRRVAQSETVDQVVLATSTDPTDDELADVVRAHGFSCYRGDLEDVLARFHHAAMGAQADIVVRLTGDCPLIDADLVDRVVRNLQQSGADYVTNTCPPTYPDGLDVEAFTFAALDHAFAEARLPSEREHVTPYIRNHSELYSTGNVRALTDFSSQRWTVDYPDDYEFVSRLIERAGVTAPDRGDRYDFFRVCEKYPELSAINQHQRNEGYAQSLTQDHLSMKVGE
jgi:spore coat polysaccharide biosynthesis protein SpsF (cytidylyltransferase family)